MRVGPLRTAIILVPILPGLALIGLTVRAYGRCDEYIRLRILRAAAFAAVAVAALSLVYFYMELLGFPHLSTAWISNIVWAVFVAQMLRLVAMRSDEFSPELARRARLDAGRSREAAGSVPPDGERH